jgi:hypothetical protein
VQEKLLPSYQVDDTQLKIIFSNCSFSVLGSIIGGGGPSSELGKRKNRWGEDEGGPDAPAAPGCKF